MSERDELAQAIHEADWAVEHGGQASAAELAEALLERGYRKVTVTPEQIETAKQKVAENQLRRYESQYQADHLTWREFYDEADEDVRSAARALGLSVAEDGEQ